MEFNVYQRKAINAPESHVVCLAAAASGKTAVLTERVRHLIVDKGVAPSDIVAITFTKLAANEMKTRLGDIAEGAFIGTIHSYANNVLLQNGVDTSYYLKNELFDDIVKKAVFIMKLKMPKVKHLLVDEFQDVMPMEFMFLNKIAADNTFYVGDDRQTIYQFRGSNDEYLRQFCMDPKYATYVLRINYRNTPDIAAFAEDFLGSYQALSPSSKTAKQEDGYVDECSFNDALDALEEDGNWGSWFILCRTNNQVVKAQELLTARGIDHVTFKKGDFEEFAELDNILNENRVKILTIHSSKGLQSQNVIVTGAKVFNEEERKISYVAATRAENALYWCPGIAGRHYKKDRPQEKAFVGRRFDKTTVDMVKF
jgi:superfamily I DNA/RNA helicase